MKTSSLNFTNDALPLQNVKRILENILRMFNFAKDNKTKKKNQQISLRILKQNRKFN